MSLNFVYFGGEPIGVPILKELIEAGLKPSLVVCNPDRPAGRGKNLTPPPIKILAEKNNIPVLQPETIKTPEDIPEISKVEFDLFVVVAYNKIMPEWLIELPKYKTINVHPSMLPLRRGTNPIRSAIIEDDRASIGVSIMLLDKEMDHGPILDQMYMEISDDNWPISGLELDQALANMGGALLVATIPEYLAGNIHPQEQDHANATYTTKINKADAELKIDPTNLPSGKEAYNTLLKIKGYDHFPGTYFFHNNKRIKINEAKLAEDGSLCLISVTPEGKGKISFKDYLSSL